MRRIMTIFVLLAFAAGALPAFTASPAGAYDLTTHVGSKTQSYQTGGSGQPRTYLTAPRDGHSGLPTGK
jgi:hypothetical protein